MAKINQKYKHLSKRQKYIASARAHMGSFFEKIIFMCYLNDTDSWKVWKDDFGNSIKLLSDKSVNVYLDNNPGQIKDIYAKSTFELISKMSYWCMFLYSDDNLVFWFVGEDGILRCLSRVDDLWINHAPLTSGINILKSIAENYTLEEDKHLNIESLDMLPNINSLQGYMTVWPPDNNQIKSILEEKRIAQR